MLSIVVKSPLGSESRSIEGKVDSGADICALPEGLVAELDMPPVRIVRAAGFDGGPREAVLYHCALEVAGRRFPHVEALATRRSYAILGRNVLADLVTTLDGPRSTLTVTVARGRRKTRA
jgi:hypothetical protein